MAKNSSNELLNRLKSSLPKADPTVTLTPPPPLPSSTVQPSPVGIRVNAPKLSVSLYARDLERLDQIKAFMQQHGFRNLSDSEALRLACRAVRIDEQFMDIYRAMQNEDGRRKQTVK